jgi:hypothetical protein
MMKSVVENQHQHKLYMNAQVSSYPTINQLEGPNFMSSTNSNIAQSQSHYPLGNSSHYGCIMKGNQSSGTFGSALKTSSKKSKRSKHTSEFIFLYTTNSRYVLFKLFNSLSNYELY